MLCLLADAPKSHAPQRKRMPSRIPSELRVLRRVADPRRAFAPCRLTPSAALPEPWTRVRKGGLPAGHWAQPPLIRDHHSCLVSSIQNWNGDPHDANPIASHYPISCGIGSRNVCFQGTRVRRQDQRSTFSTILFSPADIASCDSRKRFIFVQSVTREIPRLRAVWPTRPLFRASARVMRWRAASTRASSNVALSNGALGEFLTA